MNKKLDALVVEEKTLRMEARALRAKLAELNARLTANVAKQAEVISGTRRGAVLVYAPRVIDRNRRGPLAPRTGDRLVVTGVSVNRSGHVSVVLRYLDLKRANPHTYFYGTAKELWQVFKKTRERADPKAQS